MTPAQAEAIKTLTEARRLLSKSGRSVGSPEKRGWIQGEESNGYGGYCSIGAVRAADGPGERRATSLLARAMKLLRPDLIKGIAVTKYPLSAIINFNDDETTKRKHVLAAFDKAIELAGGNSGPVQS